MGEISIVFEFIWALVLFPAPWLVYYFFPALKPALHHSVYAPSLVFLSRQVQNKKKKNHAACPLNTPFFCMLWLCTLLAMAHPVYSESKANVIPDYPVLLFALDISHSMMIKDSRIIFTNNQMLTTSRLGSAKHFIEKLMARFPGFPVGLILFGEAPCIASPITHDHKTLLSILHESEAGMAGEKTALGEAVIEGVRQLKNVKHHISTHQLIMIMVTDGENTSGAVSPFYAARQAASEYIPVYTLTTGQDSEHHHSLHGMSNLTRATHSHIEHSDTFTHLVREITTKKRPKNKSRDIFPEKTTSRQSLIIWPLTGMVLSGFFWFGFCFRKYP